MAVLARVLCALVCGGCLCAQAGATLAQRPSSRRSLRSSEAAVTTASSQISKACDATPDPRSRVMLMMVVAAYHGSTSAEQLLMSSSNVATLCGALSWQCEGFRIEEFRRLPSRWRKATEDPWFPRSVEEFDFKYWDINFELSRFATYWDLRRPVLLEKTPERMQGNFLEQELSALLTAPMPDLMKKNGIERIQPAYLILWRPFCLAKLSSHTQDWVKESSRAHLARMELRILEHQMHIHRHLHNLSIPVLVVNLGNLMWDSQSEIDRIKDFLPCAGPLDPAFVPKLGKDMYKENSWKARGSLDDFARSIDPKSCCEYDVAQRRCGRSTDMLTTLQGNARLRAQSAQEYLQAFS
mmetsp:Transcript_104124/g.293641  ORF Transcript_104124/g.293641 Transcript_104124/m.293641 type:complete len:354 (-) Transcript_104124:89-1150(-)